MILMQDQHSCLGPNNYHEHSPSWLPETVGIPRLIDVNQAADFTRGERNVLVTDHDL